MTDWARASAAYLARTALHEHHQPSSPSSRSRAVAIILFMGLWNMFKGGDPNRSQMLMRARVIAQAVAIVVILGALFFFGRGADR